MRFQRRSDELDAVFGSFQPCRDVPGPRIGPIGLLLRSFGDQRWDVLRVLLGAVLISAAVLKAYVLLTEVTPSEGVLRSRWALTAVAETELLLGLGLLSGGCAGLTWLLAVCMFSAFCAAAFSQGLNGELSCGCFGSLQVSPWAMVGLDGAIVIFLFTFPPNCLSSRPCRIRSTTAGRQRTKRRQRVTWLALCMGTAALLLYVGVDKPQAEQVSPGFQLVQHRWARGTREAVRLAPEAWVGRRCPLLPYIRGEGEVDVDTDQWLLVLWRKKCSECQRQAPEYVALARELWTLKAVPTLTLNVSTPGPFREDAFPGVRDLTENWLVQAHLCSKKQWLVETPTVLWLREGVVVSVGRSATTSASWFGLSR